MSDPLHLFLMTNTLETGGSERQFVGSAKAISHEHFKIHLGCLLRYGPLLNQVGDITEFPLGGSFFTWQAWRSRFNLIRYLRTKQIDVAHSFDFYTNLMLLPLARLARVPVIVGSHRQLGDLLTPMQFRAQLAAFRFCDRIVCNSKAAAERLTRHGVPTQKLVVIPNGLAREAFEPAQPSWPRANGVVRVGMIARMNVSYKKQDAFLRAAARVCQQCPDAEFVLVGDGQYRLQYEELAAKLGLGSRVKFLGERNDIPAVLAGLDITAVPSSSESLPNVILESMAAGVAVVAAHVGGIPEIVEHEKTGLLTAPDNDLELSSAIERFIRQPSLRTQCAQRAREYVASRFDWDRVSEQYENLYRDLMVKGKKHSGESVQNKLITKRVRVAIVGPSLRKQGGQSVQADLLTRNWHHDPVIEVRFVPIDPEWPRALRWVERFPFLRTLVRAPFYQRALWRGTREADIVHIFSASYWSFLLAPMPAWLVARLRGQKALIHYHSGEARDHLSRSRIALRILRATNQIVVPSMYLVDVFREFNLRAEAISNTLDLAQFPYRLRQPLRPRLVCTRGFHPYYSLDIVVRAFALVKKQYPEAQLCLVGNGPLQGEIEELTKQLGLADVEFAGPIPREQIGRYYEQNDIFINASWLDNMPVSILEAFASGTPVVTTAPKGIRYLVEHEHTGLLCEPGDWNTLANNVVRLLREPELALQLARNAHEASQRCRWEAIREQWLEIYRSMIRLQPEEQSTRQWSAPLAEGKRKGNTQPEANELNKLRRTSFSDDIL
jgi:glycosyltransferase involved in cell wall biosynthesis